MSRSIPSDIQQEIIKRLPVESLIRFRSVCKAWKSLIDCSEFIAAYSLRQTRPQHLLIRHEVGKQEQACIFFRKPLKDKNTRRKTDDADEDKQEAFAVVMKKKKPTPPDNKLHFATARWSSKQSEKVSMFQFDSSKEIHVYNDCRATATLETETEFSRDARAIGERILKPADEALKAKGKSDDHHHHKLYKGINAYPDHKAGFRREQTVSNGFHGPLRAPVHIRTSARFDYQPDVCKDYKQTGYCGYGDCCKFLHDRGDFKSGWQLEKEWDESEKERKRKLAFKDNDDDDHKNVEDDGLPFACFICRHPFVNPVVTKCKHYFCEQCALKHHRKKKTCFVCNRPTLGIFNAAHEIRKKMMMMMMMMGSKRK